VIALCFLLFFHAVKKNFRGEGCAKGARDKITTYLSPADIRVTT
jgi:hypothetical protein